MREIGQPDMRPITAQRRLRIAAQLISGDDQRVMSQLFQRGVQSVLGFMSQFQSGEFGIPFSIRQRRFGRVAQQKCVAHLMSKFGIQRQGFGDIVSHILEKQGVDCSLCADHGPNIVVCRRVPGFGRETRKQPVFGGQIVMVHERLVQHGQITALAHDTFKSGRNRAGMAPQSMYRHAPTLSSVPLSRQWRAA